MTDDTVTAREDHDRLLLPTRVLALVIVPVLVAAFALLFGFPNRTQRLGRGPSPPTSPLWSWVAPTWRERGSSPVA